MIRKLRFLAACLMVLGLVVGNGTFAEPQSKSKGHSEQKVKGHKQLSGKEMVGDKLKQNGNHKIHSNGKFSTYANVSNGKIAGISVKHSEKGDIPVTKYKTNKKMAQVPAPASSVQFASVTYAQDLYIDTIWIGYAYIDDFGFEIIYWFPYDMILDGDTGAIEYYPA